ncbi:MAG: replication-associated recombination protein A [Halothiobacillaceae bacterium]
MADLFAHEGPDLRPLPERMRPRSLDEVVGQQALVGSGQPLRLAVERGQLHSLILWGPPGVGKTTLARVMAGQAGADWLSISAVMAGVKDIRQAIDTARARLPQRTVLFIDEIHRFNKSQQDALLPAVEEGLLTLIGATTENPSFSLNNALLSRARVYILQSLEATDIETLLQAALTDAERGLGGAGLSIGEDAVSRIARAADGDARRALILLEIAATLAQERGGRIDETILDEVTRAGPNRFDKGGDDFYDQISALHKSVRGSDPDAAAYWLARMIDGGADPAYLGRRLVRMASEDIGNADPRALSLAVDAWQSYERLGSPEGDLMLTQVAIYLACAPKSNAVYVAHKAAMKDARESGSLPVPMHLRNAPTGLMKRAGWGAGYRYAHDEGEGFAAGETYLPEPLIGRKYYQPVDRGLEIRIGEKLARLAALNEAARAEGDERGDAP